MFKVIVRQVFSIPQEEEELSAELYSFHEAAFRLQEMEEDVVEGHRSLLENFPKWHQTIAKLSELPDQLDFDLEGFYNQNLVIKLAV